MNQGKRLTWTRRSREGCRSLCCGCGCGGFPSGEGEQAGAPVAGRWSRSVGVGGELLAGVNGAEVNGGDALGKAVGGEESGKLCLWRSGAS